MRSAGRAALPAGGTRADAETGSLRLSSSPLNFKILRGRTVKGCTVLSCVKVERAANLPSPQRGKNPQQGFSRGLLAAANSFRGERL